MQLSDNGRKLIQSFEGLSLTAYPDAEGYSIGYGHYGANKGDTISREEAEQLFKQDIAKYETAVSLTTPDATQQQFDAMTSLTYNIGTAGFAKSTVARLHNMGDTSGAADAFRMWTKSQGAELPVLKNRREKERAVYLNGYGAYPVINTSTVSAPAVVPTPSKGGIGQFFIGLVISAGVAIGIYTRTNLLQGKFTFRKKPRAVQL